MAAGNRRRLALLVSCVALVCAGWSPVSRFGSVDAAFSTQPSFDARALFTSLPRGLTPPMLEAGPRVMAMVAGDIDADGDLDVVATDGSLDLIVWINDGTGHLTRAAGRREDATRTDASGPDLGGGSSNQEPTLQAPSPGLNADPSTAGPLAPRAEASPNRTPSAPRRAAASTRSPRAPPTRPLFI